MSSNIKGNVVTINSYFPQPQIPNNYMMKCLMVGDIGEATLSETLVARIDGVDVSIPYQEDVSSVSDVTATGNLGAAVKNLLDNMNPTYNTFTDVMTPAMPGTGGTMTAYENQVAQIAYFLEKKPHYTVHISAKQMLAGYTNVPTDPLYLLMKKYENGGLKVTGQPIPVSINFYLDFFLDSAKVADSDDLDDYSQLLTLRNVVFCVRNGDPTLKEFPSAAIAATTACLDLSKVQFIWNWNLRFVKGLTEYTELDQATIFKAERAYANAVATAASGNFTGQLMISGGYTGSGLQISARYAEDYIRQTLSLYINREIISAANSVKIAEQYTFTAGGVARLAAGISDTMGKIARQLGTAGFVVKVEDFETVNLENPLEDKAGNFAGITVVSLDPKFIYSLGVSAIFTQTLADFNLYSA